ncbi:patatin-like phospholipase family protein [Phnomibacter sp. MR]|uniref:patatin-like phospholipase family protein n=1 Tax=Phnomibacter sp. MR TaxID=3042318 RepID=UPI003A7F6A0D
MQPTLRKAILLLTTLLSVTHYSFAQPKNHGIGLTLSGGGAKGLAHIGMLKAIDSAGLNIDYITGTSMGSIVGGLYAAGYSADSIEKIARSIHWEDLLSNSIPMNLYTMEEKSEFGKYAIEMPINKGSIGLPSGFLESQELWLTLEKYFFPVAAAQDFKKLSIPFTCVAVDLLSTEPVAHTSGSIVNAIRSSMAIPGAFSPVDIKGRRYVDGGIIRNLPVQECINLGAKYMIGVSVSAPVQSLDELNSAVQVLSQVMFLNEAKDSKEQAQLCQSFISIPMGTYSAASFASAEDIIALGIEEGKKYYPLFKHLADSLKALDAQYQFRENRLPNVTSYEISNVKVQGLEKQGIETFLRQIEAKNEKNTNYKRLQNNTRDAFAYRMYKSIVYDIQPNNDSNYTLQYTVKPESPTMLKVGISENSFTRFGVQLNLTTRNKLLPSSRTMLSMNIGDNFRGLFEHLQMFGYRQPWSNRLQVYSEFQDLPAYNDLRRIGLYKYKYITIDDRFQLSAKRKSAGGFGMQWESITATPQIESGTYFDGRNNFFQAYTFWQYNNLIKPFYADKGTLAEIKLGYVFAIHPRIKAYSNGQFLGDVNPSLFTYGNYPRLTANFNNAAKMSSKWSWTTKMQTGINFSKRISLLNEFVAGGMTNTMRNQIQFAGLREGEIDSESIIALHTGPRVRPFGSFYLSFQGAIAHYDFVQKASFSSKPNWLYGTALTAAYLTPIGPAELSVMASSKSEGLRLYFNFGFPFK